MSRLQCQCHCIMGLRLPAARLAWQWSSRGGKGSCSTGVLQDATESSASCSRPEGQLYNIYVVDPNSGEVQLCRANPCTR